MAVLPRKQGSGPAAPSRGSPALHRHGAADWSDTVGDDRVSRLIKSGSFWFTVFGAVLLAVGTCVTIWQWDWLRQGTSGTVSNGTTLRNVGFLVGGVLALVFAVWRGWVAERQSVTAQSQAETSQRSLLNERYQRGAEMLGNNVLAVRLGGIYALKRLAEEHPEQYHIQIMELFCAFVRLPTKENGIESHLETAEEQDEQRRTLRADVQDVVRAICSRGPAGISVEQDEEDFKLYLRDANLSYLQVRDANLSRAWLTNTNLSRAVLTRANLSSARLRQANLSGAQLRRANLSDAKLWGATCPRQFSIMQTYPGLTYAGLMLILPFIRHLCVA